MKIPVMRLILNLRGEPFRTGGTICSKCGNVSGEAKDMTLRHAILRVLTAFRKEDRDGIKKLELFNLSQRIIAEDEPELSPEDVVKIRELIGRDWGVVVVGRCYEMLEG